MRWGVAWESQPPLLLQIRNLLAQLNATAVNGLGGNVSTRDFIPEFQKEDEDADFAIADMTLHFAKHNAQIKDK